MRLGQVVRCRWKRTQIPSAQNGRTWPVSPTRTGTYPRDKLPSMRTEPQAGSIAVHSVIIGRSHNFATRVLSTGTVSGTGQKAKNSLRVNVFRCLSNNGPSWPGPSKALGEIRGLLLSLVGERFEPRANCSASYCARPFVLRTVLKLRSTKLWRKMSSPTANCRLCGNL